MPEGPEIRRAAQAVNRVLAGRPIRLQLLHPALQARADALRGAEVRSVQARSKAMLTTFSTGDVLYSHNQLYGEWVVSRHDEAMLQRAVRLIAETSDHRVVLYSATDFAWLREGEEAAHPYLARLGPDVLDEGVSARTVAARLAAFPRRRVADALLDQQVLAGLGNYLRSEICFVARLNPWCRLGELQPATLHRLACVTIDLTRRSFRHGGVCVPDADYRRWRAAGADHEGARFHVFDREGEPCRACGQRVERAPLGGRAVYCCVACQTVAPLPSGIRR